MALLAFSKFFKISFATTNGPMLLCFAKNIMTLSLVIYILILPLVVLLTIIPMNYPIIKCRSKVERYGASELTTNFNKLRDSR